MLSMDDPSRTIQVIRPTLEQMKDFMKCIENAEAKQAHHAGLLKIIPPPGWVARKAGYDNMDNYQIKCPIRQRPCGSNGVYQIQNVVMKNSDFKTFKKLARKGHKTPRHESLEELERRYWSDWDFEELCPIYGADMEGTLTDPEVEGFNLNRLDSILNDLNQEGHRISGVNTAYLYFGLWRSSFTLHTEDCDLYSINYLHFGKPKAWYTVPPEHGSKLEQLAKDLFPDLAKKCPSFLRHKTTVISPTILEKNGIPFNKIIQYPGEFMITFPFGYHFGYNLGLNCAEATNFALPRWIDYGKAATICYCRSTNVRINMDGFVRKYQPEQYDEWMSQQYPKVSPTSLAESHDSGIVEESTVAKKNLPRKRSAPSFNLKNFINARKKRLDYIEEVEAPDVPDIPAVKPFHVLKNLNIQFVGMSNFENEKEYNLRLSRFEPFCAVCLCFKYSPIFDMHDMSRFEVELPERFKIYLSGSLPETKIKRSFNIQDPSANQLVQCKSCKVSVHRACYNVNNLTDTSDWYCDKCREQMFDVSCSLCPFRGGALKKTNKDDQWAHLSCALIIPNVSIDCDIINLDELSSRSDNKTGCSYCEKLFPSFSGDSCSQFPEYIRGYITSCGKCNKAYHVGCAVNNGLVFDPIALESFCEKCSIEVRKLNKTKELEEPQIEEIVIAKIYLHYSYARVKDIRKETFHRISFIDYTKDVQTIIENANNPPRVNDFVGVLVDGILEYGSYKSSYECQTYTVQFDTGLKLKLKRDEFHLLNESMSKRVHDKFIESIDPLQLEVV